ncbi:beta-N-acetylhexosaminidase [Pseudozobellia sp. WGM2]|uniref:beta-N-acetylhexosaminidase n=1 Tax=Pseudozobellia sp. WGM2 TaxID=2787625 RepID=UPI001ADF938C|nr:beta-N-acetylhexosaminidase [Pseudozobellia sp. WGM2]
MKYASRPLILSVFFTLFVSTIAITAEAPLIPKPTEAVAGKGQFQLDKNTSVTYSQKELQEVASYLKSQVLTQTQIPLHSSVYGSKSSKIISLELIDDKSFSNEAYQLSITPQGVKVKGATVSGVFYGAVSLLQLVLENKVQNEQVLIDAWEVTDEPFYEWRGIMLDVSRYFIEKDKIKSILDWMAFYKLNTLHWHLTDATGWRMQILKYPKLALVGGVGDHFDSDLPAQYYTQSEIQEIVDYAAKLHIKVVPEIDMPGHATAANRAYPEYSGGGSEKYPEFTFDPGKETTYGYLTDILREVNALFPSGLIHLGGDEVSFGNQKWSSNEDISDLIKREKLNGLKDVEHYFMERMADSVLNMNAKVLAWDELAEIDLPKDKTIIYWWRHDKPEQFKKALEKGFSTVVCPRIPYYLDFVQDENHRSGRKWDGAFSPIESVYGFNVDEIVDSKKYQNQILGVQGNLWTETINSESRIDYMLFPRIAALAESAWTETRKDYPGFESRLRSHLNLYEKQGIYYYNPINPQLVPEPVHLLTE